MTIKEYEVEHDYFEYQVTNGLDFPCCCCQYRHGKDTDYPCNKCGHNINSEHE